MQQLRQSSEVIQRYGSREMFMQTFHVDNVFRYTGDAVRCVMGAAPTLRGVNLAYGDGTAEEWMTYLWAFIGEYVGNYGKLTAHQIKTLSRATVQEYGYLKVSEMMLYAARFARGRYSHICGRNTDPLQLLETLAAFIDERAQIIARSEQDERERRAMEERERNPPITWEQFCERNGMRKDNPLGAIFK